MTRHGPGRDLEKERTWRAVLDRQRQSGLSVRAFCERERISEASYDVWRRELQRRDHESPSGRQPIREFPVRPASRSASVAATSMNRPVDSPAFVPVVIEPSGTPVERDEHVARVLEVACVDGSRVSVWPGCDAELLRSALQVLTSTARVGRSRRIASC